LSDLPKGILVYSAVFDVGRSEITLELMEAFDEKKVSGSWLHAMGAYWVKISNTLAKIVWTSTMSEYEASCNSPEELGTRKGCGMGHLTANFV
jgi:hypothetical protein